MQAVFKPYENHTLTLNAGLHQDMRGSNLAFALRLSKVWPLSWLEDEVKGDVGEGEGKRGQQAGKVDATTFETFEELCVGADGMMLRSGLSMDTGTTAVSAGVESKNILKPGALQPYLALSRRLSPFSVLSASLVPSSDAYSDDLSVNSSSSSGGGKTAPVPVLKVVYEGTLSKSSRVVSEARMNGPSDLSGFVRLHRTVRRRGAKRHNASEGDDAELEGFVEVRGDNLLRRADLGSSNAAVYAGLNWQFSPNLYIAMAVGVGTTGVMLKFEFRSPLFQLQVPVTISDEPSVVSFVAIIILMLDENNGVLILLQLKSRKMHHYWKKTKTRSHAGWSCYSVAHTFLRISGLQGSLAPAAVTQRRRGQRCKRPQPE
jgi:hypothetical protein